MTQKMYICHDGVDGDITYHNSKDEAIIKLRSYIDNGLDDGEWMDGVSDSFVAKITHYIKEREIDAPECYKREGVNKFVEMDITEKCASEILALEKRITELEEQNNQLSRMLDCLRISIGENANYSRDSNRDSVVMRFWYKRISEIITDKEAKG